jgi:transcriptional regulator GlxA family with amidase domain
LNQHIIDLLVSSDLAMSKIAQELKFRDEYYFNRFFSAMNGVSPLKYRKKFAGSKIKRARGSKQRKKWLKRI